MADYYQDLDELGNTIRGIVDRAVNSRNFQELNQSVRRAVNSGTEAVRRAVDTGSTAARAANEEARKRQQLALFYGSTGSMSAVGVLKIVGGGILALVTLLGSLVVGVVNLSLPWQVMLLGLGGGAGLIGWGAGNLGTVKRFKTYRRILGEKTCCSLEKLASGVGRSRRFVRREVERMIGSGLFREGHLDREGNQLITSHETYRYFEQSRLQLEQRRREEAREQTQEQENTPDDRVREVLNRGNGFIRDIRDCNDRIPGEAVSAKIDRMEELVRRIFQRAKTNPEVIPDLKKLMDYYLPMTVKLLNAYADMDAQGVQGETIAASKREIEDTLDTLNQAFEKLLDDLFRDTAMDVSSDISVLHTLLAQEGLKEDPLTKR